MAKGYQKRQRPAKADLYQQSLYQKAAPPS
jgi:hypothetical protein